MNMPAKTPEVSIIIPVLNGEKYIEKCFAALARLECAREDFEVILMDNGSTDNTLQLAANFAEAFTLKIFSLPGEGICAVRNAAARLAAGRILAFLDSDCIVAAQWLNRGVAAFDGLRRVVTGCAYRIPEDSTWVGRAWNNSVTNKPVLGEVAWLPSGNMFVTHAAFNEVGGFDENITSDEDSDLCFRIRALGYTIFSDPGIEVVHLGTPQTLISFFKKELWHGRDVFRLFLKSGRALKNLKVVLFAFFFVGAFAALAAGLIIAVLYGLYVPLWVSLLAMACLPAAVALRSLNGSGYQYAFGLSVLYLVYGVARAMCLLKHFTNPNPS